MRTFSSAVKLGNRFVIWKDFAMPVCANSCAGIPVMSLPIKKICPALGANAPESVLKNVLFPAPLGPMMEVSMPGRICTLTLVSALNPPKRLLTFLVSMMGSAIMGNLLEERAPDSLGEEQHEEHK